MELVTGLHLQMQPDDLVKFVNPHYRVIAGQCIAARGGRVSGLTVHPEENSVQFILIFKADMYVDMAGIAYDLATSLGLREASWRQVSPAPARSEPKFSGIKGRGTQCSICHWVDGAHAETCPHYKK